MSNLTGRCPVRLAVLRQLTHHLLIDAVFHHLYHPVVAESGDSTRSGLLRASEHVHELLGLEFIGQFAETFFVATCAATLYKLLVLVGKVVERHLTKEELLTLVLDFHCQAAEPLVGVIHRQRFGLLPLVPMAHQNEGQRNSDAVVRDSLQKRAVRFIAVELSNLQMA